MSSRSATDTIKGYFYQFDYTIDRILNLANETDKITVEGVEDIDITTSTETTAVQCKYYFKTEYNHSVIAKPIRLMLDHYKDVKAGVRSKVKYKLYGKYSSGQNKLTLPIDKDFLKTKFLTYTKSGTRHEHHNTLGLNDADLEDFITLLDIDINAKQYENQFDEIITKLEHEFRCDRFEAEFYFYNNALNEIRKLSIEDDENNRKISKQDFIGRINRKNVLFNKWFLELKGERAYFRELKSKYFTALNREDYERFFAIDLTAGYTISELKELIHFISKKYSKLSKREPKPYCPYVYLHGISEQDLKGLKEQLYTEGFNFIDGHPFKGSDFIPTSIIVKADYNNQIKVKIIEKDSQVIDTLNAIVKTRYLYQFYSSAPFLTVSSAHISSVSIQINELDDIKHVL